MLKHYVFMKYQAEVDASHVDAFCEKMFALKQLNSAPPIIAKDAMVL